MCADLGPFPVTITTPAAGYPLAGGYAVTVQHETLDLTIGDALVCGAASPLAALAAAQGKLRERWVA